MKPISNAKDLLSHQKKRKPGLVGSPKTTGSEVFSEYSAYLPTTLRAQITIKYELLQILVNHIIRLTCKRLTCAAHLIEYKNTTYTI